MLKKMTILVVVGLLMIPLAGCIPLLLGAGAAGGGYALAKDKGPAGTYTDDSIITSKIKSKYVADIHLKSYNISVSTYGGEVILTGKVPDEEMRQKAIHVAQTTEGVKSVNVTNFKVVP